MSPGPDRGDAAQADAPATGHPVEAQLTVPSPVGPLVVSEAGGRITAIGWGTARRDSETPLLAAAAQQLAAYFRRELTAFDLPLAPGGSTFEQAVWEQMLAIPYGQTRTYGEIAGIVGAMPQAVGGACGSNPIPIVIPCHRILAASGRSGGYSGRGGVETKHFLLALEGAMLL